MKKLFSAFLSLCLCLCGAALAETTPPASEALVLYDSSALPDWTARYSLEAPGTLLELTQPESLVSITAVVRGTTPEKSLTDRLDRAGETLEVSDARIAGWDDPFDGDGRCLTFFYTYPDGDERHAARVYSASLEEYLIEVTMDCWGDESEQSMESLTAALIDHGFSVRFLNNAAEVIGELSDVTETSEGTVQIELALSGGVGRQAYAVDPDAVLLFPSLDDPYQFETVRPDMSSLTDAILTYEESSDSPAVFRTILNEGTILYMEHIPG